MNQLTRIGEGSGKLAGGSGAAPAPAPLESGLLEPVGGRKEAVSVGTEASFSKARDLLATGEDVRWGRKVGWVQMAGAPGFLHRSPKASGFPPAAGYMQSVQDL